MGEGDGLAADLELVERAQNGDKEAFGALFERYSGRIYSYLSRFMRDHTLAKDVTVETFILAYTNIGRYTEKGKFMGWVYRIATNCARKALSKRNRERRREVDLDKPCGEDSSFTLIDLIESNTYRPDRMVMSEEARDFVRAKLAEMDHKYREIILLCDLEDMAIKAAADILRINVNTAATRLKRARIIFYRLIKKDGMEKGSV
ncbi:MAG: sigma-70 family RNA polymerase sigma factor [Candidatus Omnitrophica bacterium]|nr:sigma-70 family RNA polymerase sigma factor [Candidatus Omnitrophota bacterium]